MTLYIVLGLDNIARYCKIEYVYIKLLVLCADWRFYMSSFDRDYEDDLKKIEIIKGKYDLNNSKDVLEIYSALQTGQITFRTQAGNEFDDYIFQKVKAIKANQKKDDNNNPNSSQKPIKGDNEKEKRVSSKKMERKVVVLTRKELGVRRFILFTLFSVSVLCLGYFAYYCFEAWKVDRESKRLSEIKENTTLNQMYQDEEIEVSIGSEKKTYKILDQYKSLYNSNKTLIGWLKIADTIIDYPVMQTGDNQYYLEHNSNLEEDRNGALFLDTNCDIKNPGCNYIIYGHNMKSGKMFGSLDKYENPKYYESHKRIQFDTIYEEATYEVMYVFRSKVYQQEDVVFKYYQFYDANSNEEFQSYMNEMAELSFYDTGVTAQYGDMLLTLSTCDYEEKDGRFVVVAKRVN